ncbi:MAG: winged helix-turn-helix transcriptional regulator [Candidatus Pacebacteria bacterium]|nr:winged helix-turn-helix transcriptional regulator [Candidatus Paceibacterota bacterium]
MGDLCREINKLGKGIGNTARYRILESLKDSPKMVGQLAKVAKVSQPAVSQHLKTLKECDLVYDVKEGSAVVYHLNISHMLGLLNKLGTTLQKPTKNKNKLKK